MAFTKILLTSLAYVILFVDCHDKLPEDLPQHAFCIGCEVTVKELAARLQHHESGDLKKRVRREVDSICKEKNFKNYEYTPKVLLKACEHLASNHKEDIVTAMVEYFSTKNRKGKTTYGISHQICNKETFACPGRLHSDDVEEGMGKIVFNDETDDFDIHMGKNVRMARPVSAASHDEL